MYDKIHWSIGVTALGLLLTSAAVLYVGVLKEPVDLSVSEASVNAQLLPLGESLDFTILNSKTSALEIAYPRLLPATEVGVDVTSLFSLTGPDSSSFGY